MLYHQIRWLGDILCDIILSSFRNNYTNPLVCKSDASKSLSVAAADSASYAIGIVIYETMYSLLLNSKHAISNANMCLDVLHSIFSGSSFSQCCHKNSKRSNVIIRTSSPNLLGNIGMCQYLSHIGTKRQSSLYSIGVRCNSSPSDMYSLPYSLSLIHHSQKQSFLSALRSA